MGWTFFASYYPFKRKILIYFHLVSRKECSLINESNKISYEDLTKTDNVPNKADHAEMHVDVPIDDDDDGRKTTTRHRTKTKTARPVRMKTLSAGLTLFSLFKNPKQLFQGATMKQLYLTLLTQKDSDIQKLGLACLMTYKLEYLLPYKENLERLLEDKTFKDELMNFSSNEDLKVVSKDHHGDLVPILIR